MKLNNLINCFPLRREAENSSSQLKHPKPKKFTAGRTARPSPSDGTFVNLW
jgi:hypothetical protein